MSHEIEFIRTHLKYLKEKEEDQVARITASILPQEVYARELGYLQSIKDTRENFLALLKDFLPDLQVRNLK